MCLELTSQELCVPQAVYNSVLFFTSYLYRAPKLVKDESLWSHQVFPENVTALGIHMAF